MIKQKAGSDLLRHICN